MKKILFTVLLSILFLGTYAQVPANYYDAAAGKTGYELKSALKTIITAGHVDKGYTALYTGYSQGDTDPIDGYLWDMYSENPGGEDPYNYTHFQKQCGTYGVEGDCYNREHLMPQSVFSEGYPMRSDYHHVIPSDGKVNGMRSNYAFGEVPNPTKISKNGSKVGSCDVSLGYSGTVFEPIDEYKGDIARSLLYFATRYETQVDSWSHTMLNGTESQVYTDWFIALLLKWNNQDPVSEKEIVRNNAGYDFQGNANPFIDHPEWIECIWNANCSGLNFSSAPITAAVQDVEYIYNVTFSGEDGKTLTLTKESTNAWLSLSSITNNSATLSGTPTSNDIGEYAVSLKVNDGTNDTFQNFKIEVTDGNSLAFTSTPISFAKEGIEYVYTVSTIGNDGKVLELTANTLPGWLSFDAKKSSSLNKTLRGTPASTDLRTASVSLELTDGLKVVSQNFNIIVSEVSAINEIIITQYYEGSSSNSKHIEITNVGSSSVDLSAYHIGRWSGTSSPSGAYSNGNPLTGSIGAGETLIYKNSDSTEPTYVSSGFYTEACYFNGDDPVAIMKGGGTWEDRIDCIYAEGNWGSDKGFYRKSTVVSGNISMSLLNGSGEWIAITEDEAKNARPETPEYIGFHYGVGETNVLENLTSPFKLYPNPAQNILIIEAKTQISKLEIYSITGQKVQQVTPNNTKVEVNISILDSGFYFLNLIDANGTVSSKKFVKQ